MAAEDRQQQKQPPPPAHLNLWMSSSPTLSTVNEAVLYLFSPFLDKTLFAFLFFFLFFPLPKGQGSKCVTWTWLYPR